MNFHPVMERVRARSIPIKTTPVGWSTKTVELIELLKQNNPYITMPEHIKTRLESVRKMPELHEYLPWIAYGPKELCAKEKEDLPATKKIYAKYLYGSNKITDISALRNVYTLELSQCDNITY
jgi:hypothetical protein